MAGKDRRQINVKGGGIFQIRIIDPSGDASDTFVDIGFIQETNLQDVYNMIKVTDDAGNKINFMEAGQELILKSKQMQTAKEQIDFIRLAADRYFEGYLPIRLNNGYIQEFNFPLCRFKPGFSMDLKPALRTIELEVHALWPKADMVRDPVSYNITTDSNGRRSVYTMVENLYSGLIGPPVDTATDVATALL